MSDCPPGSFSPKARPCNGEATPPARGDSRRSLPWERRTAPPRADVGGKRRPGGDRQHPLDGGEVGWVTVSQPLTQRPAPERGRRGSDGLGVGRVERGGELAQQSRRRRPSVSLGGRGAGRRRGRRARKARGAARGGSGCAGGPGRCSSGPPPGEGRAVSTECASRPDAGRESGDGVRFACAESPSVAAPRSRLRRTVSAWSSAVWPVATLAGKAPRRAERARASRLGPGASVDAVDHDVDTEGVGKLVHHLDIQLGALAQSVVDVMGDYHAVSGDGEDQQGERVGAPGHGAGELGPRFRERAPPDEPSRSPARPFS